MRTGMVMMVVLVFFAVAGVSAQVPSVPVQLQLGVGGGAVVPNGTFADNLNTGWYGGAKLRVTSSLPLQFTAFGQYSRLGMKVPSTESAVLWSFGAGVEFPFPLPIVSPYLGVDAQANSLTSTVANAPSQTREGLGLGGGVLISLPALGSVDVSVKYQMLNLMGKDTNEETVSQISAGAAILFNLL